MVPTADRPVRKTRTKAERDAAWQTQDLARRAKEQAQAEADRGAQDELTRARCATVDLQPRDLVLLDRLVRLGRRASIGALRALSPFDPSEGLARLLTAGLVEDTEEYTGGCPDDTRRYRPDEHAVTVTGVLDDLPAADPGCWWRPATLDLDVAPDPSGWMARLLAECLERLGWRGQDPCWYGDDFDRLLQFRVRADPVIVLAVSRGEYLPPAGLAGRLLGLLSVDRQAMFAALGPARFGATLQHEREKADLTPRELAKAAGSACTGPAVLRWENETELPRVGQVRALARALNTDPLVFERLWLSSRVATWPGTPPGVADRGPGSRKTAREGECLVLEVDRSGGRRLVVRPDATWADLSWPAQAALGSSTRDDHNRWATWTVPDSPEPEYGQGVEGDPLFVCADEWEYETVRPGRWHDEYPADGNRVAVSLPLGGFAVLTGVSCGPVVVRAIKVFPSWETATVSGGWDAPPPRAGRQPDPETVRLSTGGS